MNAHVLVDPAEAPFDPARVLAILRRRKVLLYSLLPLGVVLAIVLALALPAKYRSSGTILIEQQEVPLDMVRSTVTSYADQRVQMISQRVMTTQTLLGIIKRNGLYAEDQESTPREELIDRIRKDIALNMISADVIDPRSGTPREANIAFSISYTSRYPDQAVKVANELMTLYLNENLSSRARLAQDASSFLKTEGDRLSQKIAELDGRLAEFKERNVENLPEQAAMNMQQLESTEQELRLTESRQSSLQQQKVYLESQLVQIKPHSTLLSDTGERIVSPADRLKSARSQLASVRAIYGPSHPDVLRLQREAEGLEAGGAEAQIDRNDVLRRQESVTGELARVRETRGAEHPDVQRLERELEGLNAELAKPVPAAAPAPTMPDNPAYIQIRAQLEATNTDLRGNDDMVRKLRAQLADYRRKLNLSPQVEKEYRELARDYDNARFQYQDIRNKQAQAQVAQNLETDQKSERFTPIEPPLRPTKPISPNRQLIVVLGLLLSIVVTVAAVAVREKLDGTVRSAADMAWLLGAPPLALVPAIATLADERRRRRTRYVTLGSAVAGSVALLATVHFLLWPLQSLWTVLLRRLGI